MRATAPSCSGKWFADMLCFMECHGVSRVWHEGCMAAASTRRAVAVPAVALEEAALMLRGRGRVGLRPTWLGSPVERTRWRDLGSACCKKFDVGTIGLGAPPQATFPLGSIFLHQRVNFGVCAGRMHARGVRCPDSCSPIGNLTPLRYRLLRPLRPLHPPSH